MKPKGEKPWVLVMRSGRACLRHGIKTACIGARIELSAPLDEAPAVEQATCPSSAAQNTADLNAV